jgi:T-complex protein 1 subunit gamma
MIELARAQDEEVGDGTTSVIILAGEIMSAVEGFLEREIHPTVIVNAYFKALEEIVRITESLGVSNAAKLYGSVYYIPIFEYFEIKV